MNKILNDVLVIAQKAVEDAHTFSKELDFTENSLKEVEDILEVYHSDYKGSFLKNVIRKVRKQIPTDEQVGSMAMMYGVYIGEVIRRNTSKEIQWVYEDGFGNGDLLHLKLDDKNRINPIGKTFKRLKNGREDEILFFYQVF